ncbi:MAG: helix-turn-helix domain-containing protein [Bacteroidota bacterium]
MFLNLKFSRKRQHLKHGTIRIKYRKSGLTLEESNEIQMLIENAFEIDRIYMDAGLNLDELAKLLDKSKHKISEVFSKKMKCTFYEMLNQYRIEEARKLLLNGSQISIKSIIYEVGYCSKASFYKEFKKKVGMTPKAYRKMFLKTQDF